MTVRKIIELIDSIKHEIGKEKFLGKIQDYVVTIQNNSNNLVLLKEITDKVINDYDHLHQLEIPQLLNKVLVGTERPFTETNLYQQLIDLKAQNYPDPGSQYSSLNNILSQIQNRVTQNIAELDRIKTTILPFLTKDFSIYQKENNAIFSIIFNNENSYDNLKSLSLN